MSWRAITDNDLFAGMNGYEVETVRERGLAEGQSDPIAEAVAQVTMKVRQSIRSCKENRLSPDDTHLPEAVIFDAVALIRNRLQTRFPGLIEDTKPREMEYQSAERFFRNVASCAESVERYGDEEDAPAPKPGPHITARSRRFTREDQDGI